MDLSSFKLLKEDNESYHVEHPNGKKLYLEKSKLKDKAHEVIKKMNKGGVASYAEGSIDQPVSQDDAQMNIPPALQPNMQAQAAPQIQPPVVVGGEAPRAVVPDANAANVQAAPQDMLQQKSSSIEQSLQAQKAAQQQEAEALSKQGKAESGAIAQVENKIHAMPSQQDIINQNKAKDDALFQAFQNKSIDPNRLWKNSSTGAKLSAGIGLILGGIGSGLTGQPNMAAHMIQSLIERDVDAQKTDQSKAMNAWKMNREALGNDLAANLATQNQMYTALKYKLQEASTQAGGEVALARAAGANALIDQQIAQNRMKMGMIQQGMGVGSEQRGGFSGNDPSILVPNLVPPDRQKDVFNEIERAQVTRRQSGNIMSAFDKAAEEQKLFSKNIIPGVESAQRKALKTELGPTFQSLEGTVRQAAMDNMEHNILPQVGDSAETIQIKRDALQQYLKSASAAPTAKGFGIDLSKFHATAPPEFSANPQVQQFMRDNPQVKDEAEAIKILKEHGKIK
jgi:hypothetical protein